MIRTLDIPYLPAKIGSVSCRFESIMKLCSSHCYFTMPLETFRSLRASLFVGARCSTHYRQQDQTIQGHFLRRVQRCRIRAIGYGFKWTETARCAYHSTGFASREKSTGEQSASVTERTLRAHEAVRGIITFQHHRRDVEGDI